MSTTPAYAYVLFYEQWDYGEVQHVSLDMIDCIRKALETVPDAVIGDVTSYHHEPDTWVPTMSINGPDGSSTDLCIQQWSLL